MSQTRIMGISDTVESILRECPLARDDDFCLYRKVVTKILGHSIIYSVPLGTILEEHLEYGLPSFESVTRARRKLQKAFPSLACSKSVQAIRDRNEQEMIEYARAN